jgi:hypothetical protein
MEVRIWNMGHRPPSSGQVAVLDPMGLIRISTQPLPAILGILGIGIQLYASFLVFVALRLVQYPG